MPEIDADAFFKASGNAAKPKSRKRKAKPKPVDVPAITYIVTRDLVSEKRREEISSYPSIRIDVTVPAHFFFGSEYEPTVCWCGLDQYTMGHQDVNPAYCIKCGWFSDERHKDNPNGCKEING